MKLGELLIRVRTTAQRNGPGWKTTVGVAGRDIQVEFLDQSKVSVSANGANIVMVGDQAQAFIEQYREAWPGFQQVDLGPIDEEYDGPSM